MMLAELLQSGNPLIQPQRARHPDEVINRPVGSVQDAEENPDSPIEENDFQIRNRERVQQFRELLRNISNRLNTDGNQEGGPAGPSQANNAENNTDDTSDSDSDIGDDSQNQGFLLIPRDPTNGSRPRIFSFRTQRSPMRQRRLQQLNSAEGENVPENARIHHNVKRLTHYIQESNAEQVK